MIQSTSLELNVRGWTPGVEPCAETKSSRHCHLGRDSRIFTPAGEPPILSTTCPVPTPHFKHPIPTLDTSIRVAHRRLQNVHPSRAILRTLRPAYSRNNEMIFLPICLPFHRPPSRKSTSTRAERIIRWKRFYALVDCSPRGLPGRTGTRRKTMKRGLKKERKREIDK